MADFPSSLKPSITQGYSFGASDNVLVQNVQGGVPLQMLDYKYAPVDFNVGLVLNPLSLQVFQDWFYGVINSGADKFNMTLDSGMGLENHIVYIIPNSIGFDGSRAPIFTVSFQIQAERTPSQDAPFGGNLSDLYDIYGQGLPDILAALENFTLNVL